MAEAMQETSVTSISDHVPICITYNLYAEATGRAATMSTGSTAAQLVDRVLVARRTRWKRLQAVMAEVSRGDRQEWQAAYERRCRELLSGVHHTLDGWERQRDGPAHGSSAAACQERQQRVDDISRRLHDAIWQAGEEHLSTVTARPRQRHHAAGAAGSSSHSTTRPPRRSAALKKAQEQHSTLYRRLKQLDECIMEESATQPGRSHSWPAPATSAEQEYRELKAAWRESRRTVNGMKAKYDAEYELRRWEGLEALHAEPTSSARYWQLLRRLAGRDSAAHSIVPMQTMERPSKPGSTDVRDVLYQWTQHLCSMGTDDADSTRAFDERHRRAVEEQLRAEDASLSAVRDGDDGAGAGTTGGVAADVLSGTIEESEVTKAVKLLKDGKAVGVDSVPIELVKLGGRTLVRLLCRVLNLFLRYECTPAEWSRGEVTPLLKQPLLDRRDPQSYRPITLLTHLSKVYTSIINTRLSRWCEERGLLHESVGGFRVRRGAVDQVYSMHTVCKLQARRRRRTYVCFVDIHKAYDNVWRDGLWWKLRHEYHVDEKLLRVIRQLYARVDSRYVLNGQYHTPWVRMSKGLRQGCVLSPLLFNLFVSGMCQELHNTGAGVTLPVLELQSAGGPAQREVRLASLSFADDLGLVADDADGLRTLLRALEDGCAKWRMSLNVDKTRVMITDDRLYGSKRPAAPARAQGTGGAGSSDAAHVVFHYGGSALREVREYRYLGVTLTADYTWTRQKEEVLMKARSALHMMSALGVRGQHCPVKAALRMWWILVMPVMDYAAAVWGQGDWTAADKLQTEAATLILGTVPGTSAAALRGELGWGRLRARRDRHAVAYWCGLLRVNAAASDRYRTLLYRAERYEQQKRGLDGAPRRRALTAKTEGAMAPIGWSERVCALLRHHHLAEYWDEQDAALGSTRYARNGQRVSVTPAAAAGAADAVSGSPLTARRTRDYFTLPLLAAWKKAVHADEERVWRAEMETRSSLDAYRTFKRRLELEPYLLTTKRSVSDRRATRDLTRLRCGTHELAVSMERRLRRPGHSAPLPRAQRVCEWCVHGTGAASAPMEDERHALLRCPQHAALRAQLCDEVLRVSSVKDHAGRTVLTSGHVQLAAMLDASGGAVGELNALALIAGGLWCRLDARPRRAANEWRIAAQLLRVRRAYVGRVMAARRRWQQERKRSRPTMNLRAVLSDAMASRHPKQPQHRLARGQLQLSFARVTDSIRWKARARHDGSSTVGPSPAGAAGVQGHGAARASHQSSIVPYMVLKGTARVPPARLVRGF
jgi:hypothetical protein